MKKQLHKIKLAAENFSRATKPDKNSEELLAADRQVEKYKDVLEKISKKFSPNASSLSSSGTDAQDPSAIEKRCKKVHEYRLAQAMEESLKDLSDGLLHDVLDNCAKLEKNIAAEMVENEISVESEVTKKLTNIMDKHITTILKQKRIVTKLMQDNESAKNKHMAAQRVSESQAKITQLREEQEECETKLDKERDIWAAEMFELIAEEENMANYIINYVRHQRSYYQSALQQIEEVMERMDGLIKDNNKRIYKVPLDDHLAVTHRDISYVIELCVCCLLEKGLFEEGLLRVGCAGSKLRRFRSAIDANIITPPFPVEYQDVHVIAGVLKSYLRDLPNPLLTYELYYEFVTAAQRPTEDKRKKSILNAINQLPRSNYNNLRYLTKFLSVLAQKQQHNKMSSQNIAIVMSPNLLWPPEHIETDYVQKVNSTASVNTIVELLVSDWGFFFSGEVDFYVTMSRDDLFPDNGGFAYDRDPPGDNMMTKSMVVMSSSGSNGGGASGSSGGGGGGGSGSGVISDSTTKTHYHTHSRSSSHDTSLILLDGRGETGRTGGGSTLVSGGGGGNEQMKRSQSSSSLSDTSSPPQQSSPKLPLRRKHNKQAAPTPPETKYPMAMARSSQFTEQHFSKISKYQQDQDDEMATSMASLQHHHTDHHEKPQKPPLAARRFFDSNDSLTITSASVPKPDKPPRPTMVSTECQTLNRAQYRSAKETDRANKPAVQPKSQLFVNRSTENLSDQKQPQPYEEGYYDEVPSVMLREKTEAGNNGHERPAKPAIPERPQSLMRPNSFKSGSVPDNSYPQQQPQHFSGGETLKKTQSFRGNSSATSGSKGGINGGNGSLTTLERTHIYNVDKKQVAIIDFVDTSNRNNVNSNNTIDVVICNKVSSNPDEKSAITPTTDANSQIMSEPPTMDNNLLEHSNTSSAQPQSASQSAPTNNNVGQALLPTVPPSPRGFDPKIKRPQVPAPPPPINRPKSDGSIGGDSTNL